MRKYLYIGLLALLLIGSNAYSQDIIPKDAFITAAYATGGSSQHKDKVLWLTWGAQSVYDTYGKHNVQIVNGSASYAKIDLGGGRFLKIAAVISNLEYASGKGWSSVPEWGGYLNSYAPGNYSGDSMDDMYNIGGTGTRNKLISGLRNTQIAGQVRFTITAKATIEDKPVRLSGMVIGDAESLAGGEQFYAIGSGDWTIVDLQKNLNAGTYEVQKTRDANGLTKLHFLKGNDNNTGAVAFMTFNNDAYKGNGYEVQFDVYLKGGGLTAIALGLIPPSLDMGDAPESYGDAIHMLESYVPTDDNVSVNEVSDRRPVKVNLNSYSYKVGNLESGINNYLGTTAADGDTQKMYSKDALGDDNSGTAGPNEEDAWPEKLRRFSHKLFYKKGDKIEAEIGYTAFKEGWISGWIDFNQNGVFDEGERVTVFAKKADKGSVKMVWTVPVNRVIRSTFVRLRFGYNESEVKSPIGIATGGEVEDHKIYILGPARSNPMLPNKSR